MSSRRASDPGGSVLDRIAEDIPTTPEDVEALRRARERARAGFTLEQIHLLEPPDWWEYTPRRHSFEGYEPFEL